MWPPPLTGKKVWRATDPRQLQTCSSGGRHARLSREQLGAAWGNAVASQWQWHTADGSPKWSAIRGPIGAIVLLLQRIGWTCADPFLWEDDIGITYDLALFGPKLFSNALRSSVQRHLERQLAEKSGDAALAGRRASLEPAKAFMRAKKNNSKSKLAVSLAVSNAVRTRTRLFEAGYVVEDTRCELCGEGEDTLHHRLWLCSAPCAVQARCTAGTEAIIREASAAGPTST